MFSFKVILTNETLLALLIFAVRALSKRVPVELDREKIISIKFDEDIPSLILFYDRTSNDFESNQQIFSKVF
jgi:hypothetical protein